MTLDDPAYPPALLTMPDPPPLLYIKGRLDLLHNAGGRAGGQPQRDAARCRRRASGSRASCPQRASRSCRGWRWASTARRIGAALEGVGGTVAVIGTGADLVYPAAHHALARQIAVQGAILSEWPLGTPARAANFPQRNRLIAGLVSGVVIVEAAMRSGSLITARLANEMGRDIFALPGSIHAPLSRGCHRMIKQGAKLVETPDEVLEELGFARRPAARAARVSQQTLPWDAAGSPCPVAATASAGTRANWRPRSLPPRRKRSNAASCPPIRFDPEAQRLLAALGHSPTTLEILATRTEMEDAALQTTLLQLELAGQVSRAARRPLRPHEP